MSSKASVPTISKSKSRSKSSFNFVVPEDLKEFFQLDSSIAELTNDTIDETIQKISNNRYLSNELIRYISYASQIYIKKFPQILSLVFKILSRNQALAKQFLLESKSSKLIRGLFDQGLYTKKDIESIKETVSYFFFRNEFQNQPVKWMLPYSAYFNEFFKSIGIEEDDSIDKNIYYDGYPKNTLQYMIKIDDISSFEKEFAVQKVFFEKSNPKQNILNMKFSVSPFDYYNIEIDSFSRPETVNYRKTLIQIAGYYGSVKCFKFLLKQGAKINNQVTYDVIAGKNEEIMEICDEESPNTMTKDDIRICAIKYHISHLYFINDITSKQKHTISQNSLISFNYSAYMDIFHRYGRTKNDFHFAANYGYFSICEFLLENGADIDERNSDGDTPLMCAASSGYWMLCKYLLSKNADTKAVNKNGLAPIHIAAKLGDVKTLEVFYKKDPQIIKLKTSIDGLLPYQIAEKEDRYDAKEWLRSKMKL